MKIRLNPIAIIFATIFIDLLGFGILIPVVPLLLADPRSPYFILPPGVPLSTGFILLGLLMAIFPLGQFLATPILGQMSDKYGRKKILIISFIGTALSYLLFAYGIFAKHLPLLFASRFLDGITGGNISVAQAAIADISAPKERAKNFGIVGAAFGLGFIMGPYIGGKLSDPGLINWFHAATPFIFAAGLSALNITSIIFFFPETNKNVQRHISINWLQSFKNIGTALNMKILRPLYATNFLFQTGFTFFTTFFSIFLIDRFGFNQGNIGDFFSYIGLWIVFTQAFIVRRLNQNLKEYKIMRFGLLGTALLMMLFFLPRVSWQLLLIVPLFSIFSGLVQVHSTGLISRLVGADIQGEVLGINASVQALGQSIPALISGFIAASLTPETPVIIASLTIFAAWIFFTIFYRPTSKKELI